MSPKYRLNVNLRPVEFSDANAKFYCRIYYAEEFHKMREEIMESTEEDFVRSLSHCVNWQARGGKSGAVFYATEGWIFNISLNTSTQTTNTQSETSQLCDIFLT